MRITSFLPALCVAGSAHAYLLGDETQLCWAAGVQVGENHAQCAFYAGIDVQWVSPPPDKVFANEPYNVSCSIAFTEAEVDLGEDDLTPVAHINLHSCDETISQCVPSVSSDIATHSPAQNGGAGTYVHELKLSPAGLWTTICHGRVFQLDAVDPVNNPTVKIDAAIAKAGISVVDRPPDQTYIYIICGSVGGVALIGAVAAFFIVRHIKNNSAIIKYSDLKYDNTKVFKETGVSLIYLGTYMGTEVAIKQIKSKKEMAKASKEMNASLGERRTISLKKSGNNSRNNTVSLKSSGSKSTNKITPTSDSTNAGHSTIAMDQEDVNQDGLKAIKQEIKLLNQIRHPNCVLFLGAAYDNDCIFMVTEYMSHGALGEILVNPSIEIDMKTKIRIASDCSNGVNYLHMLTPALLHADIKSGNVFVNSDLRGKIGDFGATIVETKQARTGTPFWMAPELLNGGCNKRNTDIYALGMTFWEMFSREELYPDLCDKTLAEVAQFVNDGGRPATTASGLKPEFVPFIERCWHQSPEARPTAQECYDFWTGLQDDAAFQKKYAEKKKQENSDLLYKILPPEIADQLRNGETVKPIDCPEVTILFSDIVGFTNISSSLDPKDVMDMLNRLYREFDALTSKHNLFKVETIGDAYMVAGGIFNGQDEQAEMIALQGLGMIRAADKVLIKEDQPELGTVKIRVGCHTGPIVASVVGDLNPRFCLFGDTVNFASRMESTSLKQRFQCTKMTQKKLMAEAPQFVCEVRGTIEVKGKGSVSTFFIESNNPQAKTLSEEFPHDA